MIIQTKEPLKLFNGEPLLAGEEVLTVGEALSNILIAASEGGKMKLYTLAQKAYTDKALDLDDADTALVRRSVESTNIYSNIVTGQLLIMLEGLGKGETE